MFDGNKGCSICGKTLEDTEKNFGISMSGYTFVFCDSCFAGKKDEITAILHEE